MKAFLMHRDRDVDAGGALPWNEADLTQDLGLEKVLEAMARGDPFLHDVARRALLSPLAEPAEILYRQHVLTDCVEQPAVVRDLYAIAVEAIEGERKVFGSYFRYPAGILSRSLEVLHLFMGQLRRLRQIADEQGPAFRSEGFTAFFAMLRRELDDDYFRRAGEHLQQLRFRKGVLVSARLGRGAKGTDYVLRRNRPTRSSWRQWIPSLDPASAYTVVIADRDENGFRALGELRDRGLNLAASALGRSADHMLSFFRMLRTELGFYVGCLNLRARLDDKGEPVCLPRPLPPGAPRLSCRALYDVGLGLSLDRRAVGNDVDANDRPLVVITGANQGGKSTFLRSVGLAQLMMQAGMFVGAEAFSADVRDALVTHYRREEDATMTSGKLDEELGRMSAIAGRVSGHAMVLFNESFAATNEREGAEIAGAIVRALLEAGVKVLFVTHSFELAHRCLRRYPEAARFLRAERQADGNRTFKLVEAEPQPTSYGEDLYWEIFGAGQDAAEAAART